MHLAHLVLFGVGMRTFASVALPFAGLLLGLLSSLEARADDAFVVAAAAGEHHTCVVTDCGGVECFGRNDHGQSGDRVPPDPKLLFAPAPVEQVAVGSFHTCTLDADGELDCWGRSNYGQASPPAGTYVQLASGGNHNCALDPAGHIECWGADDQGQVSGAPAGGGYSDISVGRLHSCAIDGASEASVCWGSNQYGQVSDGLIDAGDLAYPWSVVREVAAGGYHTCARGGAGELYCWGHGGNGATGSNLGVSPATDPSISSWRSDGVRQVDAGTFGTCVIYRRLADTNPAHNELICFGWPFDNNVSVPTHAVPEAVTVGTGHACYIQDDALECFGSNAYGKASPPDLGTCPGRGFDPIGPVGPIDLPTPWPWG